MAANPSQLQSAVALALATLAGCGPQATPSVPAQEMPQSYGVPRGVLDAEAAKTRMGRLTLSSGSDLDLALKEIKKLGLPLEASIEVAPVPEAENAAPEYRALGTLLEKNPLTQEEVKLVNGIINGRMRDEAATTRLRHFLDQRRDAVELVHSALDKRGCDFKHDWSKGTDTPLPEYATIRAAARFTAIESVYLAQTGKPREAMRRLQAGERLTSHVKSEKSIISFLVSAAARTLLAAAAQTVLRRSGDKDPATLTAATEMLGLFGSDNIRDLYAGECRLWRVQIARMRTEGPITLEESTDPLLPDENQEKPPNRDPPPPPVYSDEEQAAWRRYCDAMEADFLNSFVEVFRALKLSRAERAAVIRRLAKDADGPESTPIAAGRTAILPSFIQVEGTLVQTRLRFETLAAGARLLQHHRSTGRFPDRLEEASNPVPLDPFTGKPLTYRKEGEGFVLHSPGYMAAGADPSKHKPVEFSYPLPRTN